MPKISVVMPAYNAEKYIGEAIESILNQTFSDFEFIIIDDGSSDGTVEVVKSYTDPRIRFYQNEHNMGVAATLNRGLDLATGEYIARMDSDDISLPGRFEKQVAYLDGHLEVVVLGTSYIAFGDLLEDSKFQCEANAKKARVELLFSPCVAHPTVMMRRNILMKYHVKYRVEYEGTEDYALWWDLSQYGEVLSLTEPLFRYRVHANQASQIKDTIRLKRYSDFVSERMRRFSIKLTPEEEMIFFCYTSGKANQFSKKESIIFCDVLNRIRIANVSIGFFNQTALERKMRYVLMECVQSDAMTTAEKINLFSYMRRICIVTYTDGLRLIRSIVRKS
jgi:glycosyltransferase involved in cell wall biosynthesis